MNLWNETYGTAESATDYTGRKIYRVAYGDDNSKYGWDIDHIRPRSKGGSNKKCNLEICHVTTNDEKGDSFPHWVANGKRFKAKRTSRKSNGCYNIEEDKSC